MVMVMGLVMGMGMPGVGVVGFAGERDSVVELGMGRLVIVEMGRLSSVLTEFLPLIFWC